MMSFIRWGGRELIAEAGAIFGIQDGIPVVLIADVKHPKDIT